ncbi:MAG: hypothetical protein Q9220_003539 [cf. Caloplaca sp. 1 TL-2023]
MGDNAFADRCERAAFNALPVMLTSDLWAHQYLVVPNQPSSHRIEGSNPFWNTGDQSILYGIFNMPQGLPKFLSASFVHAGPNDLGHALLSPAHVHTTLPSGTHVELTCNTTYPFSSTLYYTVAASAPFTLYLRLPAWATSYSILATTGPSSAQLSSLPTSSFTPDPHTGMIAIPLQTASHITYTLDTSIRTEDRGNDTISVYHGALLYALDVGFEDTIVPDSLQTNNFTKNYTNEYIINSLKFNTNNNTNNNTKDYLYNYNFKSFVPPMSAHDHDITSTKKWNVAIDPSTLAFHPSADKELGSPAWEYESPPSYITVKACEIEWGVEKGLPMRPPLRGQRACMGEVQERVLRPYGSLKVHMAVLPTVDLGGGE